MPSQVTYTGKIGPGNTLTSKVFPNVSNIDFNLSALTLRVAYTDTNGVAAVAFLDLNGGTVTVTDTVSSNNHTFAVSVS